MASDKHSVSVLMTVFNGGRYLRQAMDSILSQSFRDFTFVIVEDHSSDDSLQVLRSYRDSRIHLIVNSLNRGQTASLNTGLEKCQSRWIARIDADDAALPGWLAFQRDLAECHPQSAVISTQAGIINQDGWVRQLLEIPQDHQGMMLRSLTASPLNHGGSFLLRDRVLRYGGYDESYRILADQDLWCRMIRAGERFVAGGRPLMAIRFHEGSISTSQREFLACAESVRVMRHHYEFMTGQVISDEVLTGLWRLFYFAENLCADELEHWLKALRKIFHSVKQGELTGQHLDGAFKLRARVFCVKRALACLADSDTSGVLEVCSLSDSVAGSSRWTAVLRSAASCGVLGRRLKAYFEGYRNLKAVLALRRWRVL